MEEQVILTEKGAYFIKQEGISKMDSQIEAECENIMKDHNQMVAFQTCSKMASEITHFTTASSPKCPRTSRA